MKIVGNKIYKCQKTIHRFGRLVGIRVGVGNSRDEIALIQSYGI